MNQKPFAILRQTSPRLAGAMAFCFGFGWLTWKWDRFGELMAGERGLYLEQEIHLGVVDNRISPLFVLLPGFAGLALAVFFGVLAVVSWRRTTTTTQRHDV